jgi:hypothetical protein
MSARTFAAYFEGLREAGGNAKSALCGSRTPHRARECAVGMRVRSSLASSLLDDLLEGLNKDSGLRLLSSLSVIGR